MTTEEWQKIREAIPLVISPEEQENRIGELLGPLELTKEDWKKSETFF